MKTEILHEELSGAIIGAAMDVLNELKPGLGSGWYVKANRILTLQIFMGKNSYPRHPCNPRF